MRFKIFVVAGLIAMAGLLSIPFAAHAAGNNMRSGKISVITSGETIDASAYLAGATVTVAGHVKGDLFCAGQSVDITGTIDGDVFCAGQNISISGPVLGSVHVAGQTVHVSSTVARSLSAFGQNVSLSSNSKINSDATIFANILQLDGKIGRDAVIGGNNVNILGNIGRNVTAATNQLSLLGGVRIGGNLTYTSQNQAQVDSSASVIGATEQKIPPAKPQTKPVNPWVAQFWATLYWLLSMLVFGLILLALAPRTFESANKIMTKKVGSSMLAGLGVLFLAPLVSILLMLTIIGLPLGGVLLAFLFIAIAASSAYSGYAFGAWVVKKMKLKITLAAAILTLGISLIAILMLIPIISWLVGFIVLIWGLGGIWMLCRAYYKTRNQELKA